MIQMPGGRPTKLNDNLCTDIVESIKQGIPPATAAELNGISKRTHERWISRGKKAKRKSKYTEYCRKVEGAKAFASKKLLHKIMESKDWKAQKYLLGFFDSNFNTPDKVEVKSESKVEVVNDNPFTSDPELRKQAARILMEAADKDQSGESGKD